MTEDDRLTYRLVIDRLVRECREGQGRLASDRALKGLWNPHAQGPGRRDQREVNDLLAGLTEQQRQVMARVLAQEFVSGVHQSLVVLHELEVAPFEEGYEGTPFHDFVGRLDGWPWPSE